MDEFFGLFLFLIFILAPLIEQIRKRGKTQPPPRRPPMRPPQNAPRSQTEEVSARSRDAAAEMIPDDLWKILTGEARAPTSTLPEPVPQQRKQPWDVVYIPPEETEDEEAESVEDVNVEVARTSAEAVRREHARRHKPVEAVSLETEPIIVSLETAPESAGLRHTAFHDKLSKTAPPLAVATPRKQDVLGIGNQKELRRAFILQEVFGRPRGLE